MLVIALILSALANVMLGYYALRSHTIIAAIAKSDEALLRVADCHEQSLAILHERQEELTTALLSLAEDPTKPAQRRTRTKKATA